MNWYNSAMSLEAREFLEYYAKGPVDVEKAQALDKLRDPRYLPSFDEVIDLFSFRHTFGVRFSDWTHFTIEFLDYSVYEFFTREHIEGLSSYLAGRISDIHAKTGKKATILDVCAGNGRLPYFLDQTLSKKSDPETFQVLAVDKKMERWNRKNEDPVYNVQEMDCIEALKSFEPDIVIASWMPGDNKPLLGSKHDWPTKFRETPSVEEYILISENYWEEYFGMSDYLIPSTFVPAYTSEGFKRVDHDDLRKFQICFIDKENVLNHESISRTVSFIRNER